MGEEEKVVTVGPVSLEGFTPDEPEAYPKPQVYPHVLPSGAKFLLRKPDVLGMMMSGEIENPLIQAVVEGDAAEQAQALAERAHQADRTIEEQLMHEAENDETAATEALQGDNGIAVLDVLIYASVLKPALSLDPPEHDGGTIAKDGKLSVRAIQAADRAYLIVWANEGMDAMARFRQVGAEPDSERDGGEVRDDAEQPARDPDHAGEPLAEVLS